MAKRVNIFTYFKRKSFIIGIMTLLNRGKALDSINDNIQFFVLIVAPSNNHAGGDSLRTGEPSILVERFPKMRVIVVKVPVPVSYKYEASLVHCAAA